MDLLKEFTEFASARGLSCQRALSHIALIRSYRLWTRTPKRLDFAEVSRSDNYIRFVGLFPCCVCGEKPGLKGAAPKTSVYLLTEEGEVVKTSMKTSDFRAVPLCQSCPRDAKARQILRLGFYQITAKLLELYVRSLEGA
jgi:hypothetical protein